MERISIGFAAGQVLALRVEDDALKGLTSALTANETWHQVETDEGVVNVRVDSIVYLRTESSETKVGFGL
ncbi:MAG: hypothetical protein J7513_03470 [Solirubrobacteraceae bacterium]|nr:hypothetical protein [Solirubrobacteraceae bacterium]